MHERFRITADDWDETGFALIIALSAIPHLLWHRGDTVSQIVMICLIALLVPAVAMWRRRPFLSASLTGGVLVVWLTVSAGGPVDVLDLLPFICCVPLAVYGTSRFGTYLNSTVVLVAAALFAVAVVAVIGAGPGDAGVGAMASGDNVALTVVALQWVFYLGVFTLGTVQRVSVARRRASQRERERDMRLAMAREIHDTLSRTLTVINVQATAGVAGQDLSALDRIQELSGGAMGEVRELLASLRASGDVAGNSGISTDQLASAMAQMFAGFREAGLRIDTVFPVGADRDRLMETESAAVQFSVYRILGESLTNVLRHQGVGSRVIVTVLPEAPVNTLHVRVESWSGDGSDGGHRTGRAGRGPRPGRGAVGGTVGSGAGLPGMRDRVERLGGVLSWHTDGAGSGHFVVEAELPLVLSAPYPRRRPPESAVSTECPQRRNCAR